MFNGHGHEFIEVRHIARYHTETERGDAWERDGEGSEGWGSIERASLMTTLAHVFWILLCFGFWSLSTFLYLGLAVEGFLDDIKDSAHADGTEEVLDGHEGVGDAEEKGGELEVDKEDDNAKVDKSVRGRDEVGLFVHNEDESSQHAGFGCTGNKKKD